VFDALRAELANVKLVAKTQPSANFGLPLLSHFSFASFVVDPPADRSKLVRRAIELAVILYFVLCLNCNSSCVVCGEAREFALADSRHPM
jgi:hypothetical protein